MGFSISFLSDEVIFLENDKYLSGTIQLGEFEEGFNAPISYWQAMNYEQQWKNALHRILSGAKNSCLITSMYKPSLANFIIWWPLYRVDDMIVCQNQLLFLDQLSTGFDEKNPYQSIKPMQSITPTGDKVSEWEVNIKEVQDFYERNW